MSSISFDNAYLLLIAIPIVALLAVPFFLAVKKDNSNVHNITSAVLHLLMGLCIVFALAGTTVETTITETDVYVLADVSYSSEKNLDTIDNYIDELKSNLPKNSQMGIVCFAKEQQLLVPLGKSIKSVKSADTDLIVDNETDIESALDYTGSLFREGVIKRIVIMTDGKQTQQEDSNALKRAVDTLRASDILVDAVYVDNNISADAKEVQMVSATATQNTYFGKDETCEVSIRSTYQTKSKITLYRGGLKIDEITQRLEKGYNTVTFDLSTDVKGSFEYEVIVSAENDENQLNNNAKFSQTVSDSIRVALITEDETEQHKMQNMYSEHADITVYYPSEELPVSIEELCQYDEIILSSADLTSSRDYLHFLDNLDIAVSRFGKSLLTFGNIYTQEKEELDPLAAMLPIRYGNADRDSKLYAIVIDASHSMGTLSKLIIAKSAAVQLVNKLNEGDYVCVVSFDGNFREVFAPDEISDTARAGEDISTREDVINKINNISTAHGTVIGFGLEQAYESIKGLSFAEKQVMLISDGLTFDNQGTSEKSDDERIAEVLDGMYKSRIVVSVLDVGRGTDTSKTAEVAENRLKNIAQKTKGNYAFADTEEKLKDVVFSEGIFDELTEVVIDEEAHVQVLRSSDAALNGIRFTSDDYVTGFIYNKAKSGTTTVLAVEYESKNVPLYSYWSYGNGRVASFATTLASTSEWDESRVISTPFFTNVLSTNIPAEKANYPFAVETIEENGYIHITVTPGRVSNDLTMRVTLTSPGESEGASSVVEQANMTFAATSYKYSFATHNLGKYEVKIDYISDGRELYSASYSYYLSYMPEYDSFAVYDIATLYKMIGSEGAVMKGDDIIRIVNDESMIASYVLNMALPLLIACVVLFVADVIVRKIKWEDIRSLFGKGRK